MCAGLYSYGPINLHMMFVHWLCRIHCQIQVLFIQKLIFRLKLTEGDSYRGGKSITSPPNVGLQWLWKQLYSHFQVHILLYASAILSFYGRNCRSPVSAHNLLPITNSLGLRKIRVLINQVKPHYLFQPPLCYKLHIKSCTKHL